MEAARTYTARKVLMMFMLSFASFCLFATVAQRFLN